MSQIHISDNNPQCSAELSLCCLLQLSVFPGVNMIISGSLPNIQIRYNRSVISNKHNCHPLQALNIPTSRKYTFILSPKVAQDKHGLEKSHKYRIQGKCTRKLLHWVHLTHDNSYSDGIPDSMRLRQEQSSATNCDWNNLIWWHL